MLAKASASAETPNFELLSAPHSLMRQAFCAQQPIGVGPHDDGCGIAWLQDGGIQLEKRGTVGVWDRSFQDVVGSISTTAVIAHNRKASSGLEINMQVSHPYTIEYNSERIAFCHNGGISDFMEEAQQRKVTDSLIFLERLTQLVGSLTLDELRCVLAESADMWNFSSMNALLLTKESVFAWRCYREAKDDQSRERYYSLYLRDHPDHICIASEPIDHKRDWTPIPNRTLVHIRLGDATIKSEQASF